MEINLNEEIEATAEVIHLKGIIDIIKVRSTYIEVVREFTSFLSSFLSRSTHQKLSFCVAMISRTGSQKIFVETRDENIDIEPIPSVLRSSIRGLVRVQIVRQKDKFECIHILR